MAAFQDSEEEESLRSALGRVAFRINHNPVLRKLEHISINRSYVSFGYSSAMPSIRLGFFFGTL
jgi:hypothetical protein